jgi:hypothetical protein
MNRGVSDFTIWKVIGFIGITAFLLVFINGYVHGPNEAAARNSTGKDKLPLQGKLVQATPPRSAVFGMIYINTREHREYIFDGAQWVPHDNTVDDFYLKKANAKSRKVKPFQPVGSLDAGTIISPDLSADEVLTPGNCGSGTGAHAKHAVFDCQVCHYVGGVLCFDISGPAVASGAPLPSFDATAKTCSNIACHGVPAGTFSYYFIGGDGEAVLNTVSYGGSMVSTPSWYATGLGCAACHGNPPRNGSNGSNVWHSGLHAGGPTAAPNQCQFCHPDATGSNGVGTAITNPALHGNGVVNVQATFRSSCFGCH